MSRKAYIALFIIFISCGTLLFVKPLTETFILRAFHASTSEDVDVQDIHWVNWNELFINDMSVPSKNFHLHIENAQIQLGWSWSPLGLRVKSTMSNIRLSTNQWIELNHLFGKGAYIFHLTPYNRIDYFEEWKSEELIFSGQAEFDEKQRIIMLKVDALAAPVWLQRITSKFSKSDHAGLVPIAVTYENERIEVMIHEKPIFRASWKRGA